MFVVKKIDDNVGKRFFVRFPKAIEFSNHDKKVIKFGEANFSQKKMRSVSRLCAFLIIVKKL